MPEPGRVILIDDSAEEVDFVRRALAARHPDVVLRPHRAGPDALEALEAELAGPGRDASARLVLLDLKLPGLDGLEILEAMRARHGPGAIPVVVFTSSREPSDLARAYAAGANSYVVKPVAFEEYMAVVDLIVRYWLEANRTVAPRDTDGA